CMTHYPRKILRERLPLVDIFIDIKDFPKLPKMLGLKANFSAKDYFSIAPKQSDFRALIPISTGCNNFCSYCVVPYSRGREYSRPAKNIIAEAKQAVKNGAKEIWLLGQNVNSYGLAEKTFWENRTRKKEKPKIQKGRLAFADLLREINEISGDFWIRFTSPHPKDFSDDLIKTMAECEKFPKYLNLPVQSGDDKILKKMNRNYTVSHYKNLVKKIRKAMPDIAISTDTIVGFPGETKKQFQNTIKLYRKIKFGMAFIAKYSPRPGTASAAAFKDDVRKEEKQRRFKVLTDVLRETSFENNKKHLGKIERVLIEEKKRGRIFGRNGAYKLVEIIGRGTPPKIGEFVEVKITKAKEWILEGKIIKLEKSTSK
ncbi:MAG: MiaB/RimO family radical SAM methylthiotransferase, partial [Patescibacteria group bacterium]